MTSEPDMKTRHFGNIPRTVRETQAWSWRSTESEVGNFSCVELPVQGETHELPVQEETESGNQVREEEQDRDKKRLIVVSLGRWERC